MNVKDVWYYDETSLTYLRWNIEVRAGKGYNILRAAVGDEAGTFNDRYCLVHYQNFSAKAHRVIWELFYGPIPEELEVDHIDGNTINNQISNLKLKSHANNTRNMKKSAKNTSGITGVSLHQEKYWKAQWYENSKVCTKCFSIATHGSDTAKRLAGEYRQSQIERLRNLGYDYTERHGT